MTSPRADDAPLVTVIIPVRNEGKSIRSCLLSVLAQTEPSLQVVVVDGESDDDTCEQVRAVMREDARVELLHNPARVVPHAMNIALAAARAPWLVRVDGHATIPAEYVARAVAHLQTGQWGGVGGLKRSVGRTPAGRAVAVAMSSRFGVGGSTYHYGTTSTEVEHIPFGCYPTEVARAVGGWDERLVVNQDFEFDHRVRLAGHRILFDPELVIDWECRQSVPDLYRQYRRYGRGKVKVALLHPDSVRPRHLLPPAFVAGAAAVLGLAAVRPRAIGLLAPYAAAVAAASATAGRGQLTPGERAVLPGAFVAMHVGWGIGFWKGLPGELRARRRQERRR